jgi:hypothetical protein
MKNLPSVVVFVEIKLHGTIDERGYLVKIDNNLTHKVQFYGQYFNHSCDVSRAFPHVVRKYRRQGEYLSRHMMNFVKEPSTYDYSLTDNGYFPITHEEVKRLCLEDYKSGKWKKFWDEQFTKFVVEA